MYILIVVIVSGCAQKLPVTTKPSIEISSKYYAVKKPNERDLEILKGLLNETNAGKYGLLIGGYYYKSNEFDKAKYYLEKYYYYKEDITLNIFKNVWLGNIYVKIDKVKAVKYYIEADRYKETEDFNFAITSLCKKRYDSFLDCYSGQIKEKEQETITIYEDEIDRKPPTTFTKEERTKILSIKDSPMPIVSSILFLIDIKKAEIEVTRGVEDYDYEIGEDNVLMTKNKKINFNFSYEDLTNDLINDESIKRSEFVFIVINDKSISEAKLLKEKLDNKTVKTEIVNYETGSLASKYKAVIEKNKISPEKVTFVTLKDYSSILKAVPYIKYVSYDPEKTNIIAISDIVDERVVSEDYYKYFNKVKFYTYLNILKNETTQFQKRYYEYFKDYPESAQYLIYDIISYIEKSYDFVTNIIEINEDEIKRRGLCFIVKYHSIRECD